MFNKKSLVTIIDILFIAILVLLTIYGIYIVRKADNPAISVKPITRPIEPLQEFSLKEILLSADKNIYGPKEEIKTTGAVRNPFSETKKWTVAYYFMSEDERYSEVGQTKEIELKPLQAQKVEFTTIVYQNLPPGKYKLKLDVLEKEQIIGSESLVIEIQGTDKVISANIKMCSSRDCKDAKAIFTKDETAYFVLESPVSNLNIAATLKIPSGKIENIEFKNNFAAYLLKNAEEGNYSLLTTLSKQGYQSVKTEKDFAVLNAAPEIKSVSVCNGDGKCENQENAQNCPQDCLPKTAGVNNIISVNEPVAANEKSSFAVIVVAILLVIAAGVAAFILKRKINPRL